MRSSNFDTVLGVFGVLAIGGVVGAILAHRRAGQPTFAEAEPEPAQEPEPAPSPEPSPVPTLSAVRQKILEAVNQYVPSRYPDARFRALAPGYNPNDPNLPKGFSTCGYLPLAVGKVVGINTKGGLTSIMDLGKSLGAWETPDGGARPNPGDFYLLGNDQGWVLHTGVIINSAGDTWKTADAGQGSHDYQEANFIDRSWDGKNLGGPAGARKLLGWLDVDKAAQVS